VVGHDSRLFAGCALGPEPPEVAGSTTDIRDVTPAHFEGVDAVMHLAGISNDPLGDLRPETTYDINHIGAIRVAEAAKAAGVERYVFSSSCSLYGAHGDAPIDESAEFNPVTPYGDSKVLAERDLIAMADDDFSPTFLRNATAFGVSERVRGDLVVNNLVGLAVSTGKVLMKSDGSPWRPLVHIEDISLAFIAAVEAPREAVHLEAFNIGRTQENYRVREVAEIVADVVPGTELAFAENAGPDKRNYRVDCDKAADVLPGFEPTWTVRAGVEQLYQAYLEHGLDLDALNGPRFQRVRRIEELIANERLDPDMRWRVVEGASVA
jgi:nucleoside-diphosphate-sugar epimerase